MTLRSSTLLLSLLLIALALGAHAARVADKFDQLKQERNGKSPRLKPSKANDDDDDVDSVFQSWKSRNGKNYGSQENNRRKSIFQDNYKFMKQHNAKNLPWTVEMNELADLTLEEMIATRLAAKAPRTASTAQTDSSQSSGPKVMSTRPEKAESEGEPSTPLTGNSFPSFPSFPSMPDFEFPSFPNLFGSGTGSGSGSGSTTSSLPKSVDWRDKGAVTTPKDQKNCGSCYTFAVAAALETLYKIKNNRLVTFSAQQILDCSEKVGNTGCNGGYIDMTMEYAVRDGLTTESGYAAYKAEKGTCTYVPARHSVFKPSSYKQVKQNDYKELQAAVAKGTVATTVNSSEREFYMYKSGVITANCSPQVDHSVAIVGYNTDAAIPYWIVKNCWGTSWGDGGYVKIAMGNHHNGAGLCGINQYNYLPS